MGETKAYFSYGVTYAPLAKATEVPCEQWDADLANMKAQGFTAFRAFTAWDRIEAVEGQRDYAKLQLALDLAQKHGLKVTINVGGVFTNLCGLYPPQWLVRTYDCQHLIPDPNRPLRPSGPRLTVCDDDPIHLAKAGEFISATVERFKAHPALEAWSVWNEPHSTFCFCPHSRSGFIAWLKAKYGELDRLLKEWSTEFPVWYRAWEDITPPVAAGFTEGGYIAYLDWLEYNETKLAGRIGWINSLVKAGDSRHPTTLNFAHSNGTYDIFKIGQVVDSNGMSLYSLWDKDYTPRKQFCHLQQELGRMRSASRDGVFKVLEAEAGPVWWVHGLNPRYRDERTVALRDWTTVALGAKTFQCWLYRSRISDAQAGEFNLVAWDGTPTARSRAAGERGQILNAHADAFVRSRTVPAEVAVLWDRRGHHLAKAEGYDEREPYLARATNNAYVALKDAGYDVDFVTDARLREGALKRYRALVIPFRPYLDPDLAELLKEYVRQGGLVIADCPWAIKDQQSIHYQTTPGAGLGEVFGFTCVDMFPFLETDRLTQGVTRLESAAKLRAVVSPRPGAEVLGHFGDGAPALIRNRFGSGTTVYFGAAMFIDYQWEHENFRRCLAGLLADQGLRPTQVMTASDAESRARLGAVGAAALTLDGGPGLLFVANYNDAPVSVRLAWRSELAPAGEYLDLIGGGRHSVCRGADGAGMVELTLGGKQVVFLRPQADR